MIQLSFIGIRQFSSLYQPHQVTGLAILGIIIIIPDIMDSAEYTIIKCISDPHDTAKQKDPSENFFFSFSSGSHQNITYEQKRTQKNADPHSHMDLFCPDTLISNHSLTYYRNAYYQKAENIFINSVFCPAPTHMPYPHRSQPDKSDRSLQSFLSNMLLPVHPSWNTHRAEGYQKSDLYGLVLLRS